MPFVRTYTLLLIFPKYLYSICLETYYGVPNVFNSLVHPTVNLPIPTNFHHNIDLLSEKRGNRPLSSHPQTRSTMVSRNGGIMSSFLKVAASTIPQIPSFLNIPVNPDGHFSWFLLIVILGPSIRVETASKNRFSWCNIGVLKDTC